MRSADQTVKLIFFWLAEYLLENKDLSKYLSNEWQIHRSMKCTKYFILFVDEYLNYIIKSLSTLCKIYAKVLQKRGWFYHFLKKLQYFMTLDIVRSLISHLE